MPTAPITTMVARPIGTASSATGASRAPTSWSDARVGIRRSMVRGVVARAAERFDGRAERADRQDEQRHAPERRLPRSRLRVPEGGEPDVDRETRETHHEVRDRVADGLADRDRDSNDGRDDGEPGEARADDPDEAVATLGSGGGHGRIVVLVALHPHETKQEEARAEREGDERKDRCGRAPEDERRDRGRDAADPTEDERPLLHQGCIIVRGASFW